MGTAETKPVPNLSGMTVSAAIHALSSAGFGVGLQQQQRDLQNQDKIISQNPAAGQIRAVGSQVDFVYGTYPAGLVPNVVGMYVLDAIGDLQLAGLNGGNISHRRVFSEDQVDIVFSQGKASGTQQPSGTRVDLVTGAFLVVQGG